MYKKILLVLIICIISLILIQQAFSYEYLNQKDKYHLYDTEQAKYTYRNNNLTLPDEEILIIFDYSKSMNKSAGYSTRLFQATDAVISVLTTIDDNTKIGLRLFGINNSQDFSIQNNNTISDRERRCLASKLVLPISANNNQNIINKFSEYVPYGASSIGYSLRQAVKNDFSNDASLKRIILVTDGTENCGDDPCRYIRNLMKTRNDIRIDIIGVSINKDAYSELLCIADSTNGKLYNANNPEEIKANFSQILIKNIPPEKKLPEIQHQIPQRKDSGIIYKNYSYEFLN